MSVEEPLGGFLYHNGGLTSSIECSVLHDQFSKFSQRLRPRSRLVLEDIEFDDDASNAPPEATDDHSELFLSSQHVVDIVGWLDTLVSFSTLCSSGDRWHRGGTLPQIWKDPYCLFQPVVFGQPLPSGFGASPSVLRRSTKVGPFVQCVSTETCISEYFSIERSTHHWKALPNG